MALDPSRSGADATGRVVCFGHRHDRGVSFLETVDYPWSTIHALGERRYIYHDRVLYVAVDLDDVENESS